MCFFGSIFIIATVDTGVIFEVLCHIAGQNIFGKLTGLSVLYAGEGSAEMIHIGIIQECIDIERAAVMTYDGIPLRRDHQVGRTYASYASQLLDAVIVFYQNHETGDMVIQSTVHHLVDNVCLRQSIMWKCGLLIVNHNSNGTLILQIFADPFIGQLTAVHSLTGLFLSRSFLLGGICGFVCFFCILSLWNISHGRSCCIIGASTTSSQHGTCQCCGQEQK